MDDAPGLKDGGGEVIGIAFDVAFEIMDLDLNAGDVDIVRRIDGIRPKAIGPAVMTRRSPSYCFCRKYAIDGTKKEQPYRD